MAYSVMSRVLVSLLILLACGWSTSAQRFCDRAAASRRCPRPPVVDNFNVEQYLGKWYGIGSTAIFKLSTEAGLICDQARYRASPAGNLSLINSGLPVISEAAMTEVEAVNVAAQGACAAARAVCNQLAGIGQVGRSLSKLSESLHLSHQLTSSARAAQQALDRLSEDVSHIQQANSQISHAGPASLRSSVAGIQRYEREGAKEEKAITYLVSALNSAGGQAQKASRQSGLSRREKSALQQAAASLASAAEKVRGSSAAIQRSLEAAGASASSLARIGRPINDGQVTFVTGTITQPDAANSAAKLQVGIEGNRAPYWIIALEKSEQGAYTAALVYSCRESAGRLDRQSLFILSREPQLPSTTVNAFLAKAESLGIYNDCENPFLLSVQRGGECGQPPSI